MNKILLALIFIITTASPLFANTASWNDNSTNEDGFILQSCPGTCNSASSWIEVLRVTANATAATFTALPLTSYRVAAYNILGMAFSNIVTTPSSVPTGPIVFSIGP